MVANWEECERALNGTPADFDYGLAQFITFKDLDECRRVRAIPKEEITKHANPDFKISVIEDPMEFYVAFAVDIVGRIRRALEEGRQFVGIFPVGPMPQYMMAARMINDLKLPMKHVHIFNMDEYADEEGKTAPLSWEGSFQRAMMERFYLRIDPELRPPIDQLHVPTTDLLPHYAEMISASFSGRWSTVRFVCLSNSSQL